MVSDLRDLFRSTYILATEIFLQSVISLNNSGVDRGRARVRAPPPLRRTKKKIERSCAQAPKAPARSTLGPSTYSWNSEMKKKIQIFENKL